MKEENDYLVNMAQNKMLKKIMRAIGLPTPAKLVRDNSSWEPKSLASKAVLIGGEDPLTKNLKNILGILGISESSDQYQGLIFNAIGIKSLEDLDKLYHFFHDNVNKLASCSRIVVLSKDAKEQTKTIDRTLMQAIEGFTKSLAKEVGKKGSTAQLISIRSGLLQNLEQTEKCLLTTLYFLLSNKSSYISGQKIVLNEKIAPHILLQKPLQNKVALVTGAAGGIGEATAKALAREGAKVVVLDHPVCSEKAEAVAKNIEGKALPIDISKAEAAEEIAKYLLEEFNGVDIVIHNAGITRDKTLARMDIEKWQQTLEVNLAAILKITERLLDGVLRNSGRIICLSSISGIAGNYGQCNYSLTKAGLIGFVEAAAQELAAREITVNAIAPGFIKTKMTDKMPFFIKEGARRINSLGQEGLPGDIAEAITFLSSPGASCISGQVLRVCGGNLVGA